MKASEIEVGKTYRIERDTGEVPLIGTVVKCEKDGRSYVYLVRPFQSHRNVLVRGATRFVCETDAVGRTLDATPVENHARMSATANGGVETAQPPTDVAERRGATPDAITGQSPVEQEISPLMRRLQELQTPKVINYDEGPPHVIVKALAGCGKTTTIVEGLKCLFDLPLSITPSPQQHAVWEQIMEDYGKKGLTACFTSFNKSIAEELAKRIPPQARSMTMHSMGNSIIRAAYPDAQMDKYKVQKILRNLYGDRAYEDLKRTRTVALQAMQKLIDLCKMELVALDVLDDDDRDGVYRILSDLVTHYGIETSHRGRSYEPEIFQRVIEAVEKCKEIPPEGLTYDYADMIWLPVALGLDVYRYDHLYVDEMQDLNRCQQALARRAGARLFMIGDEFQAIYGFSGADCESMSRMYDQLLKTKRGCVQLPLTVTRRCGHAIVKAAQRLVPEFEAHPDNHPGLERKIVYRDYHSAAESYRAQVQPGDFVLCRVNAPLIRECFSFLREGRRAKVRGRDVGEGLKTLVRNLCEKEDPINVSVETLRVRIQEWLTKEVDKETKREFPSEGKLILLQDKARCLHHFCEGDERSHAGNVIERIDALFSDDGSNAAMPTVILSSIHKAKGLEARRVFFLQPKGGRCPHPMAESEWQQQQEGHLWYVAVTRAIEELVHVVEPEV